MSLIKCKACGAAVSKKAATCPQCGEPMKRKTLGCGSAIGIVFLVLVVGVAVTTMQTPDSGSTSTPAVTGVEMPDCSMQEDRRKLIQRMINEGYWEKVEKRSTLYRVHVLPLFMTGATFDEKQNFVGVVAAMDLCEGGKGLVPVHDAMTGKEIGTFSFGKLDLD